MALHALTQERPRRRAGRNGLLQLGLPHFWLLFAILAGMLSLVTLVFVVHMTLPG